MSSHNQETQSLLLNPYSILAGQGRSDPLEEETESGAVAVCLGSSTNYFRLALPCCNLQSVQWCFRDVRFP